MKTLKNYLIIIVFSVLFSCSEEKQLIENHIFVQESRLAGKTPKPSNIPSKAPKSVICNYFVINGNMPSEVAIYCGIYWSGVVIPIPLYMLNTILAEQRTHSYNDLYIIAPDRPSGITPFSSYTLPDDLSIRSEIVSFYQKVFVVQLNKSITVVGNIAQSEHIHKQAFIDSFFNWMLRIQNVHLSTFNQLMNNNLVYRQLFNLFADYNLHQLASTGIYIGVPFGQYSTNPQLRCLSVISEYLLTNAGASLLLNLSAGTISIDQFKSQLSLICF